MNSLENKVQLIGNLGMDPEVKYLENGKVVANCALATHSYYKSNEGEKIRDTQWHNIVMWGNTAKFAEKWLRKGGYILAQGKLQHRAYEDKQGVRRYVTEVLVNEIKLMDQRKAS